jgi:hypothetical protein
VGTDEIKQLVHGFPPVGLEEMDKRAALQRRVDNKYVVSLDELGPLLERMHDDHEVLEIDGRREFDYDSTYFDTPSLDCFRTHVEGRRPRYKARTRCYLNSGDCFFEVKVKRSDGETVKRSIEYEHDDRSEILPSARELLSDTLASCDMPVAGDELAATLVTRFRRVTLVAREFPQRVTIDLGLELDSPADGAVEIDERHAIVETKTPDGEGTCDRVFAAAGNEPEALSKYRLGVGMLLSGDDAGYAPAVKAMFAPPPRLAPGPR